METIFNTHSETRNFGQGQVEDSGAIFGEDQRAKQ